MREPRTLRFVSVTRPLEMLGQEERQVSRDALRQIRARLEVVIRGAVVAAEFVDETIEPVLALRRRLLDVQQPGPIAREPIFVLQPGDRLTGCDPPVALPVDADEHIALLQVRTVELARRMRAGAELEHHGDQTQVFDRQTVPRPALRRVRRASS